MSWCRAICIFIFFRKWHILKMSVCIKCFFQTRHNYCGNLHIDNTCFWETSSFGAHSCGFRSSAWCVMYWRHWCFGCCFSTLMESCCVNQHVYTYLQHCIPEDVLWNFSEKWCTANWFPLLWYFLFVTDSFTNTVCTSKI